MAGAVELATAYIALVPSLKGASKSISDQMTPAAGAAGAEGGSSLGSALLGGLKKFALPIAAVVGAFSVGKLIKDSTEQFESYAGAVKGFGRLAGGTVEQFSGLRGAMQLSGVDVNSATGAITIFSKNLGKAGQDSKKTAAMTQLLGESFKDAHGNIKPMSELLPGLSDKFKSMPDGAAKTALATQLFGRAGAQMLPFLNKGSAGIAELTGEAKKMGLVLDDTSMRIFGDAKKSAREYTTSLQGMKLQLGQSLTPALDAVHNLFRSFMIPIIQTATKVFAAAREPVMHFAEGIQAMADRVRAGVTGLITLFSTGNFTGGLRKALGVEEDSKIVSVVLGIRDGVRTGIDGIKGAYELLTTGKFTGGIRKALGVEEDSKLVGVILGIRDTFQNVTGAVSVFFSGLTTGSSVAIGWMGMFSDAGAKIHGMWSNLTGAVSVFFSGLTTGSSVAIGWMGTFSDAGAKLHGIWNNVSGAVSVFFSGLTTGSSVAVGWMGKFSDAGAKIHGLFGSINFGKIFGGIASTVGPLIPQIVALWGALSPVQLVFKSILPMLPQLLGVFVQLATVIGGTLGTALKTLLPAFIQLQGVFVKVFQQVLAIVLPVVVKLITMLGQTLAQLIPIVVPIVTKIATLAATLVSQLAPILMQLISTVMPMVITIFGALLQAIGPVIGMIAGLLIPIIQALLPVVSVVFRVIADIITAAMQIVMGIIQVVTGIISGNWAQVWSGILHIVGGVFALIISVISGAIQLFISIIGAGLGVVSGVFLAIWTGIIRYVSTAFSSIVNGASGMLNDLVNFFGGIGGRVIGALGNIGSTLFSAGQALIQGFIDGIKGMVGAIGDAVGGVLDFAKQFFPHSPAKRGPFSGSGYTSFSGQALAKDFAKGIASQNDLVADAAAGIMTSASLTGHVGISSALLNHPARRGGGTTFNTTINQVDDPIGTAHAVARRQFALSS